MYATTKTERKMSEDLVRIIFCLFMSLSIVGTDTLSSPRPRKPHSLDVSSFKFRLFNAS